MTVNENSSFSVSLYMRGILKGKGYTIADYPFDEGEKQKTLRKVLNSCKIVNGFVATKDESLDCYIEVQLPHYCTTTKGKNRILLKVDMAGILTDRAAADAQEGGAT
jgi:hypothetical protein